MEKLFGTEMDKKITTFLGRMDRMLKPQLQLQEQIDKILEPQGRFQEEMQKYLEPQIRLQEHMKRNLEPQRKLQEQIQKILEPHWQLQAQMEKYLEPHRRLQEQFEKYSEPGQLLQVPANKYLQPLNSYLSDLLMDSVSIGRDGLLSVSGEIVDVESINRSLEGIAEEYSDAEEFFEKFFQRLEKLSGAARIAVIYIVLPYFLAIISNLTTPIYEEWWAENADINQRAAKKEIIREANEIYHPDDLAEYRFVYATVLHVRDSGSMSAEIIDELYLGKTVKLTKKSKRWSLVEYQEADTGGLKEGWVFSRYLHKFLK
ncbi:MAG: SH3 domain-containing protein [Nitrospirales bacterium]